MKIYLKTSLSSWTNLGREKKGGGNMNKRPGMSRQKACLSIIILLGPLFSFFNCSSRPEASVTIKKEIITTYPFSDPDPVPVFARSSMGGAGSRIYPYFVFSGFSPESKPQEWTVIRLKNRYLEVSLLPEVGGKIWGAKDLRTGYDFLYTNHVLKFREIALRGPWTSGGIEFNFGVIGHGPHTATPVDYYVEKKPDGSVSSTVGNYDWPSRTRWRVTVTVYPHKAYFETSSRWTNPTPYKQSYYSWMCAAVPASADLKYIFPGKYQIGHDYSVPLEPWPVDKQGRDLSFYRNNAFGGSKSYFVVGIYDNFYGGYYEKTDSGFGHWALYSDMPGKKIWIWDLSRAGEIWVDLLTDSDGQYTEPQAGRLLNQSDHGSFAPAASDSWKQLWFSYSGIGEMKKATDKVILSLNKKQDAYELGLYSLQKINQPLVVSEGGKEIISRRLKMNPAEKIIFRLENITHPDNLLIQLGEKNIYQPGAEPNELERPFKFYRPVDDSVEALYLAAEADENERNYQAALEKYQQIIAKEPGHRRGLSRLAELFCRRGEEAKALAYARKALEISMYDPEANYIYGVIARSLNRLADAKEALGWAARSSAYALPAYCQLAEIALREKDYSLAEEYARRAINYDQQNPLPYELLAVSLRKQEKKAEAFRVCQKILALDPLDHMARYELYLLAPENKNRLKNFIAAIRNEFPAETFIELALFYHRIAETDKARELLELAGDHPEALVWLAYLGQSEDSEKSKAFLEKAAAASPFLIFPFREESIPVLRWAAAQKPDCWKFRYYLGLIYWHKGRMEEARKVFETLDEADFYPVFIARAYLNPEEKERAYADLKKALALSPEAWRTWHHLINFELTHGRIAAALHNSVEALKKFPENMYIQADTVKALLASGEYRRAAEMLDKMHVLPYEGASEVHSLFVRTHIHLALANMMEKKWAEALEEISRSREYPENLGSGRPYEPDQRIQDYLEAVCHERLGNKDLAREKYATIISYTEKFPEGPYAYFARLALEKLGRKREAAAFRSPGVELEEFLKILKHIDKSSPEI